MSIANQGPYYKLGEADGIRRLVNTFYDIVESDPQGAPLRIMHNEGNGLAHVRETQFEFLSGFLGGPKLYVEHFGHSNVKRMHEHLRVTALERDSWLTCMDKALAVHGTEPKLHRALMTHFTRVADALVNTP